MILFCQLQPQQAAPVSSANVANMLSRTQTHRKETHSAQALTDSNAQIPTHVSILRDHIDANATV